MSVRLRLPSVLRVAVGRDSIRVDGETVGEALDAACAELPRLRHHLLLADDELRPHVLLLLGDRTLPRDGFRDQPLRPGDELVVHQAISGG